MRTLACLAVVLGSALVFCPHQAAAQITDSERVAARDLFKQGDELQRAGKFAEALDKFQRAQQVIQAPTNVLRVAECQAALFKLVEAAESYRAVTRWTLSPGAPAAFQSAIDQAKGELAQLEPRIPRLLVQVSPAGTTNQALVIDGTAFPAALLGEPIPLDPGPHKVLVTAQGFSSDEQSVALREHETQPLKLDLHAVAASTTPAASASAAASGAGPAPPPPPYGSASPEPSAPPPFEPAPGTQTRKPSQRAFIFGAHAGAIAVTGSIPLSTTTSAVSGDLSGVGGALALDAGVQFLGHWYLGFTLEHAQLGGGKNPGSIVSNPTLASSLASNTTLLGVVGEFIANPEKPSLLLELGLGARWYNVWWDGAPTLAYSSGDLLVGVGLWLPFGRSFRAVPILTASFGSFGPPGSDSSSSGGQQGHAFLMLGVEGLFSFGM